ncbi:D-tyrosyl-tRNA(Tyr) deacylase [bacterium]|nr:D-tyrosyl-tRNA(Tyr) deacylase [bacterium]
MRALIQRVSEASVQVDDQVLGKIRRGFLILLGVGQADTETHAAGLAKKTANLRIFSDESHKMNLSLKDVHGEALVISQFTLYADTQKGHRPSFTGAAPPDRAERLYEQYVADLKSEGVPAQTGRFAAMMSVRIVNEGPVTIWLET